MNYYNGIVFKGFLNGISTGVLAGGRYDKLMHRIGRRYGAIGFALYLDLLESLERSYTEYDVDVLLLYDENVAPSAIKDAISALIKEGKSVSAQKAVGEKLRAKETITLFGEGRK